MKTLSTAWILFLFIMVGCLPQAKEQSCGDGSIFNPTSRNCVPLTSGGNTSGISIATRSPQNTVIPVALTQTTQYDFAVTVNNPLNEGYAISWKFYPPSGVAFGGNPLTINSPTYSFIPAFLAGLSAGTWTLAAEVFNTNGSLLLASAQWSIVVSAAPTPTLSINTAFSDLDTNVGNRTTTDHSLLTLAVDINNPGGAVATRLHWFYDGVAQGASTAHAGPAGGITKTFFGIPTDTPAGVHVIRAELRNSTSTTILNTLEWTIYVVSPNLPQLSTLAPPLPDTSVTVQAVHQVALNASGFTSAGNNLFTTPNSDFCVAVTNHLGTLGAVGGVTVQFRRNGATDNGMPLPINFTASNSYVCLGDALPTFALTLANPGIGEFQNVSAVIIDTATATVLSTVTWGVSVRVQNTPPVISINAPASPAVVQQGGAVAATDFVLNVADVDTIAANMTVNFFFDGVAMNGINKFPGSSITTPDCTRPVGEAPAAAPARFTCSVVLPAYGLLGRLTPPGSYTITAHVIDQGAFGGAPQTSNTASWTVTPTLGQSSPVVAAEGVLATTPLTGVAATAPGDSFIALLATPTTPIANGVFVNEGTNVLFNILVKDDERDNFNLRIDRCLDVGCSTTATIADYFLVSRVTDALGRRATYSYRLPENLLVGAASGVVTFRVSVQDKLPDGSVSPILPVSQDITLDINNNNPFPVWAGAASANPALSDAISVVTGMPFTFDPGPVTDASTADGNQIRYQWEMSTDAGASWDSITGATDRVLVWTPSNDIAGTNVRLRLCLGDEGTGNPLSDCVGQVTPSAPPLPATTRFAGPWTTITPVANTIAKDAATPALNGAGATWLDVPGRAHYLAYVNTDTTVDNSTIVVEKYAVATDGTMSLAGTIEFPSEADGPAYDASRLSIVGQTITIAGIDYKSLYLSYVTQSATASITPRLRVRRIDITNDHFQFSYNGITESDPTTPNLSVVRGAPGAVTMSVDNGNFDAGEVIYIGNIALTALAAGPAGACEFVEDATAATAMANIRAAYTSCVAATTDPRGFSPTGAVAAEDWPITDYPHEWIDVGSSLYLGKTGDVHLQDNYLLIPFLDNLNGGKISFATINTIGQFTSGSLASQVTPFSGTAASIAVNTTVTGQEIATSHNGTANIDAAIINATSGVTAYRLTFTAPSTIAVTGDVPDVFGSGIFVQRPRIATGSATTNNHVFIMGENLSDPNKELLYARIDASTYDLAPSMPVTPLDSEHEQSRTLSQYQIRALSGNKRMALAVLTTSGRVLVSLLKPETPALDFPMIFPEDTSLAGDGSNVTYPAIDVGVAITTPTLAMSPAQTFTLGDDGATAGENQTEGFMLLHPSSTPTFFSSTFVNITEESISATSATGPDQANGFQAPYVR